jgi:cytochrome bd ubiquinol oxidase subunit II
MLYIVIGFLWTSLLIYVLSGGADFGAGIIELFTSRTDKNKIRASSYHAIGPIWEANHMWLVIAVVVVFVGFPQIYTTVSVYLHIPLVIMLIGIIARGTAFSFRNYDAVQDGMQAVYNRIYVLSSFITPLFLGIICGSAVSHQIDPAALNFYDAYIFDWLNWFSIAVGLFTVFLCGFLASVYLFSQAKDRSIRAVYSRLGCKMSLGMVLFTGILLWVAYKENIPLLIWIVGNKVSLTATVICAISFAFIWIMISNSKVVGIRVFAIVMVTSLLIAVTYSHFPNVILLKDGHVISLIGSREGLRTVSILGKALLGGSVFILPGLIYLVYTFSGSKDLPGTSEPE